MPQVHGLSGCAELSFIMTCYYSCSADPGSSEMYSTACNAADNAAAGAGYSSAVSDDGSVTRGMHQLQLQQLPLGTLVGYKVEGLGLTGGDGAIRAA